MQSTLSKKRNLDSFFTPVSQKKVRVAEEKNAEPPSETSSQLSHHAEYPFPLRHLPSHISDQLSNVPAVNGRIIDDQPDLDLLYFEPFIPKTVERDLFEFLRRELFFYRVQYKIKRGLTETQVNTPRYTTVFGVDSTSLFTPTGTLHDAPSQPPAALVRYRRKPRPIPHCLATLLRAAEAATSTRYNFCLVNYYATGADSISYHSDDERFLGPTPSIASLSLGAPRDFLLKHKPPLLLRPSSDPPRQAPPPPPSPADKPLKLPLASGDMVLMRGSTQARWLHSIPKRKNVGSGGGGGGRINITFRKAVARAGTDNYYCYNVGEGPVWRWDFGKGEMRVWGKGGEGLGGV